MTRKEAKDLLKALPGETVILSMMRLCGESGNDAFMLGLTCQPNGETMSHAAIMTVAHTLEDQFAQLRSDFLDNFAGMPGPEAGQDPRLQLVEEESSVAGWWNRHRYNEAWCGKLNGRAWEKLNGEEQESIRELHTG